MNKLHLFFFKVVIVLFFVSCNHTSQKKQELGVAQSKYKLAMQLGDLSNARTAVYDMLALDSNNHSYYDSIAKLSFKLKQYAVARKAGIRAFTFLPNLENLKVIYHSSIALKNYTDVEEYGSKLVKELPNDVEIMYSLAYNFVRQQKPRKALDLLEKVIINPSSKVKLYAEYRGDGLQKIPYTAAAYNLLGFIYSGLKQPKQAELMFQEALGVFSKLHLSQGEFTKCKC